MDGLVGKITVWMETIIGKLKNIMYIGTITILAQIQVVGYTKYLVILHAQIAVRLYMKIPGGKHGIQRLIHIGGTMAKLINITRAITALDVLQLG